MSRSIFVFQLILFTIAKFRIPNLFDQVKCCIKPNPNPNLEVTLTRMGSHPNPNLEVTLTLIWNLP